MKIVLYIVFVFSLFLHQNLWSQELEYVQGELLVLLNPEANEKDLAEDLFFFGGKATKVNFGKKLTVGFPLWKMTFDFANINDERFLEFVRKHPAVQIAQFNHFLDWRAIPNDPEFPNQWQYINTGQSGGVVGADLDIDLAWDVTTGGVTATGDTIVVCIIDQGVDPTHQDFGDNLWINRAEIPNNNIDDDNNGFVDDYRGWNTILDNDDISGGPHGTEVSGIIGAKGNNNRGVSGINWNIKMMQITVPTNISEDQALTGYAYALDQRKRYNSSNGTEGAFVVATNSSFGINFGKPADFPLWCAMYDSLGNNGILNAVATTNDFNTNVDEEGDIPSTCPSEFTIAVTSLNDDNVKEESRGVGPINVDLGAYGTDVWTTKPNNSYGTFRGTSSATPHVTGAIALLYAAPCPTFIALAKSDPANATRLLRQYILDGVKPNVSLANVTATGGSLNLNNSMQLLVNNCLDCVAPTSVRAEATDVTANLLWIVNDSINQVDLRWREKGTSNWNEFTNIASPFPISNLIACTEYEFQLKTFCRTTTLDYDDTFTFRTDGCCEAPVDFGLFSITNNTALARWSSVLAAESYNIRIKRVESTSWDESNTTQTSFIFGNLTSCTDYEVQIQTVCEGEITEFSPSTFFSTSGCGACTEQDYCESISLGSSMEWIAFVGLNTLQNSSGNDGGYRDFTGEEPTKLDLGATYTMTLEPGFAGNPFGEDFKVWIDTDQDGNFENDEVIFDALSLIRERTDVMVTIPADAMTGITRMRVVMQFNGVSGSCPFVSSIFGEAEDYCVELIDPNACTAPTGVNFSNETTTTIDIQWEDIDQANDYNIRYRKLFDSNWLMVSAFDNLVQLNNLEECQEYETQIQSVCGGGQSAFSTSLFFNTKCRTSTEEIFAGLSAFKVFPNPFTNMLFAEIDLTESKERLRFEVFNTLGQRFYSGEQDKLIPGKHQFKIDNLNLLPGIYLLKVTDGTGKSLIRKMIRH